MVWHIFKKDWKLMWRPTAAVAGLLLAYAFIQWRGEFGGGNPVLQQFSTVLLLLWLMASVILIVMVVHQDALPGTRQDWLTRPVRRGDVLIEKVLFAAMAVAGPMIACDVLQGLGSGFSLRQTLSAALARGVIGFIVITLPALALGALTQSIAEAMVLSVALLGGGVVFTLIAIGFGGGYGHQFDPTDFTGVGWIPNVVRLALVLTGAAILLLMQYRTRKTFRGRIAMGVVLLIALCSQCIPWRPVFAVQQWLSPQPGVSQQITVAWEPPVKPAGQSPQAEAPGSVHVAAGPAEDSVRLNFPLLVGGVPQDSVLKANKSEVVLRGANGDRIWSGAGGDLEIREEGAASGPESYNQTVTAPGSLVRERRGQPVRADVTYSMTLFRMQHAYTIPAVDGDQMMLGWGRCKTRVNSANTAVEMTCMQMGKGPTCATVYLEAPRDGSHNPINTACSPDYAPYKEKPIPDAVSHFRLILPIRDPPGQVKLAVDDINVEEARIVIREYAPQAHFTRHLISPLIAMQKLLAC